jgi:uncharacterized membrane protein YtjA (UPF0391 family)
VLKDNLIFKSIHQQHLFSNPHTLPLIGERILMKFNSQLRLVALLAALFAFAGMAAAQGPVNDAAVTTSNLAASATFQTALRLDITTATAGSTVGGTSGLYTLAFGNVNGLGLGIPGTNITRTAVSGGYMYTTPITLTPGFSGFAGATATITVGQDAADDAASKSAAREGAAAATVAVLPAVASATLITAAATNGTSFDRYIGVFVPSGNGGVNMAGSRSMNLVYTITAP